MSKKGNAPTVDSGTPWNNPSSGSRNLPDGPGAGLECDRSSGRANRRLRMSAGTYVGTLDPSHFLIFGSEDLSFAANAGNGPNLPILFGQAGPFSLTPAAVPGPVVCLGGGAGSVKTLPLPQPPDQTLDTGEGHREAVLPFAVEWIRNCRVDAPGFCMGQLRRGGVDAVSQ